LGGDEDEEGTLDIFKTISTSFYNRVFNDEEQWFRDIFAAITREEAIQNQYEFLAEQVGGPKLYSERKGKQALIGRHGPYRVDDRAAGRWLAHMRRALFEDLPARAMEADLREALWLYLQHTAYYISTGRSLVKTTRLVGYGSRPGGYHHG